jgi:hypothetical protein
MQVVLVIMGTVIAWVVSLGILSVVRVLPRPIFITLHYVLAVGIFAALAFALRKSGVQFSAITLASVVVSILLSLELFYWVFINPEAAALYLTTIDWLIPAGLIFVTVYVTALYTKI